MLANIPQDILLTLIFAMIVWCILSFIVSVITVFKAKKEHNYTKMAYCLLAVLCTIVAGLGFIFNMGWLRFILIMLTVPFTHTAILLTINLFAVSKIDKTTKLLKGYTMLSLITYVAFYLFLPDAGDIGPTYAFLGLIKTEWLTDICYGIAGYSLFANIALMLLQIIETIRIKKRKKQLEV